MLLLISKNIAKAAAGVISVVTPFALAFGLADAKASEQESNVRGQVVIHNGESYIIDDLQKSRKLVAASATVSADLESLESGDYITGHGVVENETVVVDAIEFIGLRRLLGRWFDKDNQLLMNFQNFTNAEVRSAAKPSIVKLHYALIPDQKNRWTILLGDQQTVTLGILSHYQNMVRIDLINSDTGKIERTMRLSPVRPFP